jgi:hypothetical protein
MTYTVDQIEVPRAPFGSYHYRILKGDQEFAIFSHDFRGECGRIRVTSTGHEEDLPFSSCTEILTGGGPLPFGLSDEAINYLESLNENRKEA